MKNCDSSFEDRYGNKFYYLDGKLHRTDGPAVMWSSGRKFWYIDGQEYTFKEWIDLAWNDLPREKKMEFIYEGFHQDFNIMLTR